MVQTYEGVLGIIQQNEYAFAFCSNNRIPAINPRRYQKIFAQNIWCSTICNSKRLERTQMFTVRGMERKPGHDHMSDSQEAKESNQWSLNLDWCLKIQFPHKRHRAPQKNG